MNTKQRRPRIAKGQVVYSTNPVQLMLAKALTIVEYYRPISCKRVRRVVLN